MPHQYKRRTLDEAIALAMPVFREQARDHLSDAELEELKTNGTQTPGSFGDDWKSETGFEPDPRLFYEIQLYRPSDECPYIDKYFARILVTRDRCSEGVWIMWKPPVPEYVRRRATADPTPDPQASSYLKRPGAQRHMKVLEVLRKWDPIGVLDDPAWPRDEYDAYAPDLIRMLDAQRPRDEMVRHLGWIVSDHMCLGCDDREHTIRCVQELIDFWDESKGV